MQRFKSGDSVLILPRFAHLYPGNTGSVISVQVDAIRAMFNEYLVKFDDGSEASVFEFQLLENGFTYPTFVAALIFDSNQQSSPTHARGQMTDRQIILQTQSLDIDMKIKPGKNQASIIGQVLERGTTRLGGQCEVTLMKDNISLSTTVTDGTGTFRFPAAPQGPVNLQVLSANKQWRILGMFAV